MGILAGFLLLMVLVTIPSIWGENIDFGRISGSNNLMSSDSLHASTVTCDDKVISSSTACHKSGNSQSSLKGNISQINGTNSWHGKLMESIPVVPAAVWHTSRRLLSSSASFIGINVLTDIESTSISETDMPSPTKFNWKLFFDSFLFRAKCLMYFSLTILLFWLFVSAL